MTETTLYHEREAPSLSARTAYLVAAALTGGVILFLRFYRLDDAPRDIYPDITILLDYVGDIVTGRWPFYFNLSTGPLYHYLIAPLIWILGFNFMAAKIASVIISLCAIGAVYLLARELNAGPLVVLLAVFLTGVSSWFLIFSRLGNSQILTPLLSALAFYFLARFLARRDRRSLVAMCLTASLGLYVYPQSFFLVPAVLLVLLYFVVRRQLEPRYFWRSLLLVAIFALPFAYAVSLTPDNFTRGYIGGKIVGGFSVAKARALGYNALASLLMLFVRGDPVFRSNPRSLPQLDVLSGFFFLTGLLYILRRRDARLVAMTVWPYLFLQLPSILVLNYPVEVPSASRSLLITPFVYIITAFGLAWIVDLIGRPVPRLLFLAVACALIGWLNVDHYFNAYVDGLPDHNVSYNRLIAQEIDQMPARTKVWFYGCCWGRYQTPQWRSVLYSLGKPRSINFVGTTGFSCAAASAGAGPKLIIFDPASVWLRYRISTCFPGARITTVYGPRREPIYSMLSTARLNQVTGTRAASP
jgi:4-amino-4-deoxy-L-arabinose transferase-like glycosyltransferase